MKYLSGQWLGIKVATIAPMKRGLKDGWNGAGLSRDFDVATIAPMKRGLKDDGRRRVVSRF